MDKTKIKSASTSLTNNSKNDIFIVGIGISAGGLETLRHFFEKVDY